MSEEQALIMYGDGLQALYYDEENPHDDRHGNKVQRILVVPGSKLRQRYRLTDEDLNILTEDGRRGIWVEYPVEYLFWRSKSKISAVLDVACAFDGTHTPLMDRYKGLLELTERLYKKIDSLKTQIGVLELDMKALLTEPSEYVRRHKELIELMGPIKDEGEEDA